jgi:hypothetical protein
MKKILILAVISALAFTAPAQVAMTATNGLTMDTVTNTATKNLVAKVKTDGSVSIVFVVTKISGTVGGTATLQGSNNGTDYGDIATAYTITDATQSKTWDFDKTKYKSYQIKVTGTGTMSASIRGSVLGKN